MKHLKLFEEMNFKFDDTDWVDIEAEKIIAIDKKRKFLDFEEIFFEDLGMTYSPNANKYAFGPNFQEINKYYTITIYKTGTNDGLGTQLSCHIQYTNIAGRQLPQGERPYENVNIELIAKNEKDRLLELKKLLRKIYVSLWHNGCDEESIKEKEELETKMKDIDPNQEEDWTN